MTDVRTEPVSPGGRERSIVDATKPPERQRMRRGVERQPSLTQAQNAVRMGERVTEIVGGEDKRRAGIAHDAGEDLHDFLARGRVETGGRLVGQHKPRLGDQRPCDRDPLGLAAGKTVDATQGEIRESDAMQARPARAFAIQPAPGTAPSSGGPV